jgi:hypothetical protein
MANELVALETHTHTHTDTESFENITAIHNRIYFHPFTVTATEAVKKLQILSCSQIYVAYLKH